MKEYATIEYTPLTPIVSNNLMGGSAQKTVLILY